MTETVISAKVFNPDGIDARGMGSLILVPALADPAAPTVAEISAGIIVSCAAYNWTTSVDAPTTAYAKYCDKNNRTMAGRQTWTYSPLIVDDDPQRVDTTGQFDYLDQVVTGQSYFMVDVRGLDAMTYTPEAGQRVDVHPIKVDTWKRTDIDPTAEAEKLRREYFISNIGDVVMDAVVVA